MMSRILVAIDDSRPAMAAGVYAIQLAVHEGAEIHFVAVAEPAHTNRHALRHIANLAIETVRTQHGQPAVDLYSDSLAELGLLR